MDRKNRNKGDTHDKSSTVLPVFQKISRNIAREPFRNSYGILELSYYNQDPKITRTAQNTLFVSKMVGNNDINS